MRKISFPLSLPLPLPRDGLWWSRLISVAIDEKGSCALPCHAGKSQDIDDLGK